MGGEGGRAWGIRGGVMGDAGFAGRPVHVKRSRQQDSVDPAKRQNFVP